ncbi:hypothetical protein [Pseudoalteromonas peptidolytica]|uniref:Uncharacterized protein n=1 Tax=Pseudoalteromonas peptidolytica F12-50-A1 TaxID=1315280 RepID=A0A8I0MYL5_9GAMM|nr:hypothetical protein [Pseudoalteromonas peptidolytica]MBE0347888.1 hypothetical protein [Pseudoalteromonas peptidolytica F12-50-A1]NLR15312.1 hypothetical protein [Pseudoalteromonas peptidolytica]GEK08008.1 hypothetical protein PPE03_02570 [Pseudoalteromonas peptidolytica]
MTSKKQSKLGHLLQTKGARDKAAERTAQALSQEMDAVNAMYLQQQQRSYKSVNSNEQGQSGATVEKTIYKVPVIEQLSQVKKMFEENGGESFDVEIPLSLIKPRADNHRLNGTLKLSFDTYMELLPSCPDNWQELDAAEYVESFWASPLAMLVAKGKLHGKELSDAMTGVQDLFKTAVSLKTKGQRKSIDGFLAYDEFGAASHVVIIDGERRLRAAHLYGRETLRLRLAVNERAADGLSQDASDLDVELATLATSYEANSSSVSLSLADTFRHYHTHYRVLCQKVGKDVADAMSTNTAKVAMKLTSESKPQVARFLKLVRHPQSELLLEICSVHKPGRESLIKVANDAIAYAQQHGISCDPVHVYAFSVADEKIDFSIDEVPQALVDEVMELVNQVTGKHVIKKSEDVTRQQVALQSESDKKETVKKLKKLGFPTPESDNALRDRQLKMLIAVCARIDPTLEQTGELLESMAASKGSKEDIDTYRQGLLNIVSQSMQHLDNLDMSGEDLSGLIRKARTEGVNWSELFQGQKEERKHG